MKLLKASVLFAILLSVGCVKHVVPLGASLDPLKYSEEEFNNSFQQCIDQFYGKATTEAVVKEIVDQMCKEYNRKIETCVYTGTEAGEHKWRWLNKCVTIKLKKIR